LEKSIRKKVSFLKVINANRKIGHFPKLTYIIHSKGNKEKTTGKKMKKQKKKINDGKKTNALETKEGS